MKALTDEVVAKALGWKRVEWRRTAHKTLRLSGINPKFLGKNPWNIPQYTTKLDAIVREIEARGLLWEVMRWRGSAHARVGKDGVFDSSAKRAVAPTAPLALCHALLQFLKEKKG